METALSRLTSVVARIVDGLSPEPRESLDIPSLMTFLDTNKYPLLALNHENGLKGLYKTAEFQAAWQKQESIFASLRSEYVIVRDRWAEAGIPCILIKSAGRFPSFPYTSDNLDVLVREDQMEAAATILKELGYIELKNIEEPHKYLFRKFRKGQCVSAIHLHTWVGWNVEFLDTEAVWQNSRTSPDDEAIQVPSPEDVILITIAHSFYENKKFRLADIVKIRECWQQDKIDWAYVEQSAARRGWLDGLHFCLLVCAYIEKSLWRETSIPKPMLDRWETSLKRHSITYRYYRKITQRTLISLPLEVSFTFSKFLYYSKILRDQQLTLGKRLSEVIKTLVWGIKLKSGIRPQPAFLISLSGADGSGKTEHGQTLSDTLTLCEIRNRYYWSRCGNSWFVRLLRTLTKTFRRRETGQEEVNNGAPGRQDRLQNGMIRFLWTYLVSIDMVITYFFHVKIPLLLGCVVICDRYVYDAAAEIESALPVDDKFNRLTIKLMLSLAPRPNAPYLLDLPEEVCTQRKDDNTDIEYLQKQRETYIKLMKPYHLRVKRTDRQFGETSDEIIAEILPSYYSNFETFLNRLLLSNPDQRNPQRYRGRK